MTPFISELDNGLRVLLLESPSAPAAHLPFVIGLEADRMRHTLFEPEEVESERTVIISEREGAENFPTSHLSEEVNALAFKVHSYRHPVIGWKSDLRRMTRDDLYHHYRTYYHPRNEC